MSNAIKTIIISDTPKDYKRGSTVINCNQIKKVYTHQYIPQNGDVTLYAIKISVIGEEKPVEGYGNCDDADEIIEELHRINQFICGISGGNTYPLSMFSPKSTKK